MPLPSELLELEHRAEESAVIVVASGDIDMLTVPALVAEFDTARELATPPRPVVADFTKVNFLGSSGLAALVEIQQKCADAGTPLRLVATGRVVPRAIEAAGLQPVLPIDETVEGALNRHREAAEGH
ncbi:STAS domain-containing protein [Amycolatopsis magusensis]|uniref:Anti-sigma factor antagonist n=1 Tax=Amycolatopsis magusensis TaxID=882444 RepID=A0ABS4Q057_9PSEU|nr:STAS domain-containing protein [Amycolatopsis magusensis]MBP2185057.1 anti-sigma B factor antagonist [Amycolatopsis magusensis]MDI5980773.1 STAS domain-containing protein [Amycolatopsis magusensis]